jgi:aldehyde dehydrogenase (NAD+)
MKSPSLWTHSIDKLINQLFLAITKKTGGEMLAKVISITKSANADIASIVARLRQTFDNGRTSSMDWRVSQLRALRTLIGNHEREIFAALHSDLGKGEGEALSSEVAFVRAEIDHSLKHLHQWTKPERVSTPLLVQPGKSYIVRDPLGVVLVIGAWNLPVPVLLGPALAAIAAGNAVVMKPSELAPATSALIARLIPQYLDTSAIAVVEGGVDETTQLLEQKFDHIFYTGNGTIGRIVAIAGAKNLTPVTLELGGKNPAIVEKSCDMVVTARRLAWAKWMNVGQVCVSPDYVLVDRTITDDFIEALQVALREFYGATPQTSTDYGRIVNTRHHDRLTGLLSNHGGTLVYGGEHERETCYFGPTIITNPDPNSPLMAEEIFGPILPVISYTKLDEAISFIRARPKALAVHIFSKDGDAADKVEQQTFSGAFLMNDAIINHRVPDLPFGGVGSSGSGAYHGRAGFETFSHRKSVLRRPTILDTALRYPPYSEGRLKMLRKIVGS